MQAYSFLSMRMDQQISPANNSSSSSGLLADIDMGTRRLRQESELEVDVQKLKDMSITGTKGDSEYLIYSTKQSRQSRNILSTILSTRSISHRIGDMLLSINFCPSLNFSPFNV